MKGNSQAILRRDTDNVVKAKVGNQEQDTWFYSPSTFYSSFRDQFSKGKVRPIGYFVPPSYLENFFRNRKGLLNFLFFLDRTIGRVPWHANQADHFYIEMRKKE